MKMMTKWKRIVSVVCAVVLLAAAVLEPNWLGSISRNADSAKAADAVAPPTDLTEITWGDFTGLEYKEYVAPNPDGTGAIGTYSGDLNGTLFNGNVILGESTDIRFASSNGWAGLLFNTRSDGALCIQNSTFDTSYANVLQPATYGLASFIGNEFNLKISTAISGNDYTFGVWVNDIMVGDYFTLTEATDGEKGTKIGLYDEGSGNNITVKYATVEVPTSLVELSWANFYGLTYQEYVAPVPDGTGARGTYPGDLNGTLLNGNVTMGADTEIRFAGPENQNGWYGIIIHARVDGTLEVSNSTFSTGFSKVFYPSAFGLASFVDTEFNLKISTAINGNDYTFGIWVNDQILGDYFTLTAAEGNAGSCVGLYKKTTYENNITLSQADRKVPTDYTELRWTDFSGFDYQEYVAPQGTAGTFGGSLDKTMLNGDIILGENADIRFASQTGNPGWSGFIIKASSDGKLYVNHSTYDNKYDQAFEPADYGLETFVGTQFNLKVSTVVNGNNRTFGIWVNDLIVDYFTLVESDGDAGSIIGLYDNGSGNSVTLIQPLTEIPDDYTKITWTSFEGLSYQTYVTPDPSAGAKGTYSSSLNRTLFEGNVIIGSGADIRYAGQTSNAGWSGFALIAMSDGRLKVHCGTYEDYGATYNKNFEPADYGLSSFIDTEFNLKISTKITGTNYTFAIWINDKLLGDMFTMAGPEDTGAATLGLYKRDGENNVTLNPIEIPTDFTELSWTDFTGFEYKEYTAPAGYYGTYGESLHRTLLNGDIIFGANTDIRFASQTQNPGWSGLIIKADESGKLYVNSGTYDTTYDKAYNPADYGLQSFVDTQFNLKVSTEVNGDERTFGIWVNDSIVDYFTLVESGYNPEGKYHGKAGSIIGLYDNGSGNSVELREANKSGVPTDFMKISWKAFKGLDYQEYVAPNPDGSPNAKGTYSGDLNGTLLDGNIIMGSDVDIRFAGSGWSGLMIRTVAENGSLEISNSTFDTSYYKLCNPADYGLTSFIDEEFNLKISTEISGNDYTFGIWINNKMIGDYFTLTEETDEEKGTTLGLYHRGSNNDITLKGIVIPADFKELSWTDFVGFEYKEYVKPPATTGIYGGTLNKTFLNGNVILDENADIRYASQEGNKGWSGFIIRATASGLMIDNSTYDNSYNKTFAPEAYGLTSFVDTEFNLKVSTEVYGDMRTFGIWVNDIIVDYFTLVESDGDAGSVIGLYDSDENGSIILKAVPQDGLADFDKVDWTGYTTLKPYTTFGIKAGAYTLDPQTAEDAHFWGGGTKFDKVVIHINEITYDGDIDLGFGGENVWVGFRLRSNSTDGTLALQSGYTGGGEVNQLIKTPIVMTPGLAGVELVGGTYDLKISMVYTTETTIKIGIWFNDKLYNNNYFTVDISDIEKYTTGDKLGVNLGMVSQSGSGGTITLGKDEETLNTIYWELDENSSYTVPSNTTDEKGNTITELTTIGDHVITYSTDNAIYTRTIYIWQAGEVRIGDTTNSLDLVRVKRLIKGENVETTESGKKAADLDRNGELDGEDARLMRRVLLGDILDYSKTLSEKMLGEGKEDVMPILGYYGPSASGTVTAADGNSYASKNTATQDIYNLIADAGVNIVTAISDGYTEANQAQIKKHLTYAENAGVSIFVRDNRFELSKEYSREDLQTLLDAYQNNKAFAGVFLADEPRSDVYPEGNTNTSFEEASSLGKAINGYGDLVGYVNLHPFYEGQMSDGATTDDYQTYLNEYISAFNPQYLSYDYYLFSQEEGWWIFKEPKDVDNSEEYIQNMVMIRNAAKSNNIPFWFVAQAGSNWNDGVNLMSATTNDTPSEGQFKWQVSTALAFGAKGITYFPLLQPHYFALTEGSTPENPVMDYDRNGLIAEDGSTTVWYDYAQEVNKHIAAVDEVLMNATNEGVIPVSGYAASNITSSLNNLGDSSAVRSSYKELQSVSTKETTYGAVVGCFDYNGKTALYVVNYDVTTARDITLTFTGTVNAKVTVGETVSSQSGSSITINVESGGGALVVLE